jgi:hypothetical protein
MFSRGDDMFPLRKIKFQIFVFILVLLSLSCALPGNDPGSGSLGSADFPQSGAYDEGQNWQDEGYDSNQSLFQPVMIDVLTEMAHAFGFPTPDVEEILGAGAWVSGMRCGINDDGCITYTYSEMNYEDGTVSPAYFEYYYPIPGTVCQEEIIVTVNHLSDTYLGTLEYLNFFDEYEMVPLSDDYYEYMVHLQEVDTGFSYQLGYSWIYGDIMVDFMRSGTTMVAGCYGPEDQMPLDFLTVFYEILQAKGLAPSS